MCSTDIFDKYSIPSHKIDNTIKKANAKEINVAWSKVVFELWYLLHFLDRTTKMGRDEYKEAISNAVNASVKSKSKSKSKSKKQSKTTYIYQKNSIENYAIMSKYGNQDLAIQRAQKQEAIYNDNRYHTHNPCTTVYKLVNQLLNKDKELIDKVMDKIHPKSVIF